MTVDGWQRTCPGCEIRDGELVERISPTPTFRCTSCGYVWDGSKFRLIFLSLPPDPDDDERIDALVERLMEAARETPAD
jgi:rubredoxin